MGEVIPATRDGTLPGGGVARAADLSNPDALKASLDELAPQLIVNAAAYTAVDRAESEPVLAQAIDLEDGGAGDVPSPDLVLRLAALLHDSAKEISKDEMREILRAYPQYAEGGEERPAPVWHGVCAAILARTQWGVTDEAVLSAIACHTAGKPGMTRLDKILYLADMTSAERDWPGVEKLRKLEKKNLDAAMLAALKQTNDFVLSQGKPLDPMSKAAYEDILARSGKNER